MREIKNDSLAHLFDEKTGKYDLKLHSKKREGKITNSYAKEMAEYLCNQLEVEKAHPANLSPEGKEFYQNLLTTDDSSFETYLYIKIYDFIEGNY